MVLMLKMILNDPVCRDVKKSIITGKKYRGKVK